jgi:hypothetical protein
MDDSLVEMEYLDDCVEISVVEIEYLDDGVIVYMMGVVLRGLGGLGFSGVGGGWDGTVCRFEETEVEWTNQKRGWDRGE